VIRRAEARVGEVRRWLTAARAVHADRARLAPAIARATGLTPQGVELGFASLERDATDVELRSFVAAAGDASHVHVILSANVFVAPLRAIALARAAAPRVTVRPSQRDPVLAEALVEAAGDDAVTLSGERDVALIQADRIDVYGRDATVDAVRARARAAVVVRGHGAGLGIALLSRRAGLDGAAKALAVDVVTFDQRGCLSPRVALIEGDGAHATAFAEALHAYLAAWGTRVPRGKLAPEERAEATRWAESLAFAGRVWKGDDHLVATTPAGVPCAVPPPGRHVHIVPVASIAAVASSLEPLARFVVAVGTDDPASLSGVALAHARVSVLGEMQRPPLDGPVDRRSI
jgi:hypothetical protein